MACHGAGLRFIMRNQYCSHASLGDVPFELIAHAFAQCSVKR